MQNKQLHLHSLYFISLQEQSIIFLFFQINLIRLHKHIIFFVYSCRCSTTIIILISWRCNGVEVSFVTAHILQYVCTPMLCLNQNSLQLQHMWFNFVHVLGITFMFRINCHQPTLSIPKYFLYVHAAKLFYLIFLILVTIVATLRCDRNLGSSL